MYANYQLGIDKMLHISYQRQQDIPIMVERNKRNIWQNIKISKNKALNSMPNPSTIFHIEKKAKKEYSQIADSDSYGVIMEVNTSQGFKEKTAVKKYECR